MTAIQCLARIIIIKKKNLKIRKENETGHEEWGDLASGKRDCRNHGAVESPEEKTQL